MAPLAMSGNRDWVPTMPHWFVALSGLLSGKTGAVVYSVGTTIMLVTMFIFRRFFVRPMVAWSMFNLALLAMGLSVTVVSETNEMNFMKIVTKPDNVPIVALVFLLGLLHLAGDRQGRQERRSAPPRFAAARETGF